MERMQSLWIDRHVPVLSDLILKYTRGTRSREVVDLGCGTAFIMQQVFRQKAFEDFCYFGLDIDQDALDFAQKRAEDEFLFNMHFLRQSVLTSQTARRLSLGRGLILSLSNTFLALGSVEAIRDYLRNVSGAEEQPRRAILSVVPWDDLRRAYHLAFQDWVPVGALGPNYAIKNNLVEKEDVIEQTLFIREDKTGVESRVKHHFLKMDNLQFESFMHSTGWKVRSWIHPFDGAEVNPGEHAIPEFFAVCESP
jgi:SAM-dependent methyltransferase